jgi:LuxR family maltose regulon positive regulatory protein
VVALSAQQIALMLIIQGRLDEAATFISQARAAFHERGELASLASLQAIELYSSLARGQAARTISAVGTSLRRLNEADTVAPDLRLRLLLAIVLGEGGEPKPAFTLASDLADRMAERGYRIFLASAELYAAHLASKLGNQAVREQRVRSGWEIAEDERLEHLPLIPAQALSDVAEEAFRRRLTPATVERVLRRQIPDETREMLTRLLGDSSADVRARAATLVGELGISSAYTSLRALAKDRSAEVRQASENALARLVYRPPYRLHVKTLGGFSITRGDQEVRDRDWRSSKARQLFQVLLTEHGRALPRDQVIELLWPDMDPEPAANNLRVTINRLSKALEPDRPEGVPPTYVIQYSETYTLNMESDIEVDSHLFSAASEEGQQAAQRGQRQVAITSLRRAVELYSGTYLPDCIYESWSEVERERLSMLFNETALLLASLLLEDGQTHEAIGLAWRVLEFDRLNEEAYLLLMRAHATLGERSAALRLYERCAAVLREELDVEPLPETTAFYNQLRDVHS